MGIEKRHHYKFTSKSEYRSMERELSIAKVMEDESEIERIEKWLKNHRIRPNPKWTNGKNVLGE